MDSALKAKAKMYSTNNIYATHQMYKRVNLVNERKERFEGAFFRKISHLDT